MLLNLNWSAGTLTCGATLYYEMVSLLEPADFCYPLTIRSYRSSPTDTECRAYANVVA
jgi:hypothetical protein